MNEHRDALGRLMGHILMTVVSLCLSALAMGLTAAGLWVILRWVGIVP